MTTGNCCNPIPCCEPVQCGIGRWGASFAFILVLFILLVIVGAAWC